MSNVQTLLAKCREMGAELSATTDGHLTVKAPAPLPEGVMEELRQHKAELMAALSRSQHVCSFCGTTNDTWLLNRGTCWQRVICQGCQGKVSMPTAHLCDPSLPLTAPCKGQQQRQPWTCSVCSTPVEVESVEEVNGQTLTFWRCPQGCSVGVTPASVAEPPVMVSSAVQ